MAENALYKHLDATGLSQVWAAILANFVAKESGKALSTNDFTDALKTKLDAIAENAQVNVIESVQVNGVALDITDKTVNVLVPTGALASLDKVSKAELDTELAALIDSFAVKATTLAGYGITDAYTKTETYTKTEADEAIKAAVDVAVAGVYKVKGSIAFASLTLDGQVEGYVYNITDEFVTTADFIEGAGTTYPAGTNVVIVNVGSDDAPSLKYDVMAGTYDFSDFVKKSDIAALTAEEIAAICVLP